MSPTDFISAAALIVALLSFFVTRQTAKESQKLASESNQLAGKALKKAEDANEISQRNLNLSLFEKKNEAYMKFNDIFAKYRDDSKNYFYSDYYDKLYELLDFKDNNIFYIITVLPDCKNGLNAVKELISKRRILLSEKEKKVVNNHYLEYAKDPNKMQVQIDSIKKILDNNEIEPQYIVAHKQVYCELLEIQKDNGKEYMKTIKESYKLSNEITEIENQIKEKFNSCYAEMENSVRLEK